MLLSTTSPLAGRASSRVCVSLPTTRPRILGQCLAALIQQTFADFEVWIIYDRAPVVSEETGEMIRLLAASHPVREWKGTGEGQVHGHNLTLWKTDSEHCLRLDDDVLLCKDALAKMVDYLDGHSDVGAVGGIWFNEDKRARMPDYTDIDESADIKKPNAIAQMHYHPMNEPREVEHLYSASLYRVDAMRKAGGWPLCYTPGLHHREETDGTHRLRRMGWKLVVLPDVRGVHLWAPGGIREDPEVAEGYGEKRKADDATFFTKRLPSFPALVKSKRVTAYSEHSIHIAGGERHFYATLAALSEADDLEVWGTHVGIGHRNAEDVKRYFGFDIAGIKGFKTRDEWNAGELDLGVVVSHAMIDQFPAKDYMGLVLFPMQRRNLRKFSRLYGNSRYTAWHINKLWDRNAGVIYPPPNTFNYKPRSKRNRILLVGWFSRDKGHGEAVQAFKNANLKGWKLTLVGWQGDSGYMRILRDFVGDDDSVEILAEVPNDEYRKLVEGSRILLGMRGLTSNDPKHQEHFGLSVPEAMSAGTIPVVYRSGGYLEVYPRFTFSSVDELSGLLKEMAGWPKARWKAEAKLCAESAKRFGYERYRDEVLAATYEILRGGATREAPYMVGEVAQEPDTAVVIPNYKHESYLAQAVGSALASTYRDFEIVVVDDGSPGKSETALHYKSDKVRLLRQKNAGPSAARNLAISETKADYILPLDADDMLLQDTLRRLREANTGNLITYGNCILLMGDGEMRYVPLPEYDFGMLLDKDIIPQTALFPKTGWEACGGYRDMDGYEDWELWINLGKHGYHGRKVDMDTHVYRVRDSEARHLDAEVLDESLKEEMEQLHADAYRNPRLLRQAKESKTGPAWLQRGAISLRQSRSDEMQEAEVVYEGPDDWPFNIRGDKSRKAYKVRKGRPFMARIEDLELFRRLPGFKVAG